MSSKAKSAGLRKQAVKQEVTAEVSEVTPVKPTEEVIDWQQLQKSERLQKIFDAFALVAEEERDSHKNLLHGRHNMFNSPLRQKIDYIPDRYRSNDIKEDLILEFTERFRQQYVQLYPFRPPLLLSPKNEVGIHVSC
jgi:hypothetical protein